MNDSKTLRLSNFELLRIICMLLIIAGHLTKQSGILDTTGLNFNKSFAVFLGSASGIADNIFVMIGAWFLVEKSFKSDRIIKIYFEVFTYCVPITILMIIFLPQYMGLREMVRGLIPYGGSPLWFATVYISMLLLSPFMNLLLDDREKTRTMLIILFFINVIPSTLLFRNDFFYSGEIVWFCFLYLLIGYIKKNGLINKLSQKSCLLYSVMIYAALLFLYFVVTALSEHVSWVASLEKSLELSTYYIDRYHTLPAFLCSIFIFSFFARLDLKNKKWINDISSGCFGIYIIHQSPGFAKYLWFGLFNVESWQSFKIFPLYYIGTVLAIFVGGVIIDYIRRHSIEKWINNSSFFIIIKNKIDLLYDSWT